MAGFVHSRGALNAVRQMRRLELKPLLWTAKLGMILEAVGQFTTVYIVQSITRKLFKNYLVVSDLLPPPPRQLVPFCHKEK